MKNTVISIIAALLLVAPSTAKAQRSDEIPSFVKSIYLEGHQKLRIVAGEKSYIESETSIPHFYSIRGTAGNMYMSLNTKDEEVTLYLKKTRSHDLILRVENYSTLEFCGNFNYFTNLRIETEDYAKVMFVGDTNDTIRTEFITLHAKDFSRITSDIIIRYNSFDFYPADYSRIVLAGIDEDQKNGSLHSGGIWYSDHGKIFLGRQTPYRMSDRKFPEEEDFAKRVGAEVADRAVDMAREVTKAAKPEKDKKTKKSSIKSGDFYARFAWGWHNWGNTPLSGFSGVDGPAELHTSMNNVQLEFNFTLAESRWIGLSAGLGLEWNRYKFTGSEVLWDATAMPHALALGTDPNCTSSLKTRYVTLPITLILGDRDDWHLELAALPGIGWTGNNTGLRRQYGRGSGSNTEKDYTINRSLAPYKLDFRAAVMHDGIGVYFQVSPLSAFGDYCQELFPVKFGIIL